MKIIAKDKNQSQINDNKRLEIENKYKVDFLKYKNEAKLQEYQFQDKQNKLNNQHELNIKKEERKLSQQISDNDLKKMQMEAQHKERMNKMDYDTNSNMNNNFDTNSVLSMSDMNNCNNGEYDPENMWFDYQALFDKTRNCILGLNDDIEVKHTDFKENQLARLVIFEQKYFDHMIEYVLSEIINDDTTCYYTLISNFHRYRDLYCDEESLVTVKKNLPSINLNFFYFVGIMLSLGSRVFFDRQYLMNDLS